MPFDSIPISDLVTDNLQAFTGATLTKMRDNLETFHDHISEKGKPLVKGSFDAGILTDSNFTNGGITSRKWLLGFSVASVIDEKDGDFQITADGTEQEDTAAEVISDFAVTTGIRIEGFYTYRLVEPVLAVKWEILIKKNGSLIYRATHNGDMGYGGTVHFDTGPENGTETFEVFWKSKTSPGGSTFVKAPRQFFVFGYSI